MAKAKRDIYQEVTDRIIKQLEEGTPPWVKPWKGGNSADPYMPYNADSRRAYSGINVLLLMSQGFSSNGWMTYKQAAARGGQVMKGEKGTLVTLFKPSKGTDKDGEEFSYFLIRGYTVFNMDQIDWSADDANPPSTPEPSEIAGTTADQLAQAIGCDLHIGGNKACYIPSA
jgi:antirestriction protein ArdC